MGRDNFAVGDECIVLGDSKGALHGFTKCEEVVIEIIERNTAYCKGKDDCWWVHFNDLKLIKTSIINLEEVK